MTERLEVGFERDKYLVPNPVVKPTEKASDGPATRFSGRTVSEAYVEFEMALCIHFSVVLAGNDNPLLRDEGVTHHFCAFYHRADVSLNPGAGVDKIAGKLNRRLGDRGKRKHDVSVFVDVGEVAQNGQGVGGRSVLCSEPRFVRQMGLTN